MFITVSVQLVGGFRHGSLPPFPSSDKVEQVNGCHHPKHHLLQTCRAVCQVWRMKSERKVIKAVPNVNLQYKVVIESSIWRQHVCCIKIKMPRDKYIFKIHLRVPWRKTKLKMCGAASRLHYVLESLQVHAFLDNDSMFVIILYLHWICSCTTRAKWSISRMQDSFPKLSFRRIFKWKQSNNFVNEAINFTFYAVQSIRSMWQNYITLSQNSW